MKYKNFRKRCLVVLVASVVAFSIPGLTQSPYLIHIFITIWINIIVTASLRFIINMGEWSFAHVPLMGMGAYISALLTMKLGLSFWIALPLAGLMTAVISVVIYLPSLPTTGTFFFFSSYAFGEVMRLCWIKFKNPFGGAAGLILIPPPNPIHIPRFSLIEFSCLSKIPYYYLSLVCMLFSLFLLYRLERSRLGTIADAIRESNLLSEFVGIKVLRYKMVILVIGSAFAGVAGSLYAHYVTLIMPTDFYWGLGVYIIIYATVGGTRDFAGPIVGVILFVLLREFLRPVVMYVPLVYGLILAITLVFMPEGLTGLPKKFLDRSNKDELVKAEGTNAS